MGRSCFVLGAVALALGCSLPRDATGMPTVDMGVGGHDGGPLQDAGMDAFVPNDTGVDAFMQPLADMGVDAFTPDAFVPPDMGMDAFTPNDAAMPTCDNTFSASIGVSYFACIAPDNTHCVFYAQFGGHTCEQLCQMTGHACTHVINNSGPGGPSRCMTHDSDLDCTTTVVIDGICTCSFP